MGSLSAGTKRSASEVAVSPPSGTEVKTHYSYISSLLMPSWRAVLFFPFPGIFVVFALNKKISSESHATSVVDQLKIMLRCTRHGYNSPHNTY